MGARFVATVTADFIESRAYSSPERRRLATLLRQAFDRARAVFPNRAVTDVGFRISAGDEFQFVLDDPAVALPFVLFLRSTLAQGNLTPMVRFRAAIGVGPVTYAPARGRRAAAYEWDGPAFARAREGLDSMTRRRGFARWTTIITGQEPLDRTLNVVLGFQDYMQQAWTVTQWEAVHWALRGFKGTEIAARIKVRHQNVSKRLSAAGWTVFEPGLKFANDALMLHPEEGAK
jgi:hypothetical protein